MRGRRLHPGPPLAAPADPPAPAGALSRCSSAPTSPSCSAGLRHRQAGPIHRPGDRAVDRAFDVFDFRLLDPAWQAAAQARSPCRLPEPGHPGGAARRRRPCACRPGPVHGPGSPVSAGGPAPGARRHHHVALAGVVVLARIYTLLLATPARPQRPRRDRRRGAVWLSAACFASRDIYRVALLSAAAQTRPGDHRHGGGRLQRRAADHLRQRAAQPPSAGDGRQPRPGLPHPRHPRHGGRLAAACAAPA